MKRLKRGLWVMIAHLWAPFEVLSWIINKGNISEIGEYIDAKIDKYY